MDGYSKQMWKSREQLKCDSCSFTSFREEEMVGHVRFHKQPTENDAAVVATEPPAPSSRRASRSEPTETSDEKKSGGDEE